MDSFNPFGTQLKNYLDYKGIRQKDFAKKLGINASTLNGYIKNTRQPDFELVKKIASELDVSLDYLFDIRHFGEKSNSVLSDFIYQTSDQIISTLLNVSEPILEAITLGQLPLSNEQVKTLSAFFHVSPNYIINGQTDEYESEEKPIINVDGLTPEEIQQAISYIDFLKSRHSLTKKDD